MVYTPYPRHLVLNSGVLLQDYVIIQPLNFELASRQPTVLAPAPTWKHRLAEQTTDPVREMNLLEQIERDPDVTQASLATQLGVAVGTVNWHLKRLVAKGYVKVKRASRRKLRYIITPDGLAFRARLTVDYVEQQFLLYRNTRKRVRELIEEIEEAGYDRVSIKGDGDLPDICRLTCLEQGIQVVENNDETIPVLEAHGLRVILHMEHAPSENEEKGKEKE